MNATKTMIDFSLAPGVDAVRTWPVSWSSQNIIVFGRGNRVYYKNLQTTTDEIKQLCKVRECSGDLRLLECGGKDMPNIVASCAAQGYVQLWDITTKKTVSQWTTPGGVHSMKWNGPVLTIGGPRGTIKHYDTRISPQAKMKEQAKRVTRHQAPICSLSWNSQGKLLASGDETGLIYCWDTRQNAPLDVGELIQRRRKMQHNGPVHVSLSLLSTFHALVR